MHDKDSQLIYEAYTDSIVSEKDTPTANADPLAWAPKDIITLEIGSYPLKFIYRGYQATKGKSSYFHKLLPAEDYTKYGALPNITTGDEGPNLIYTNNRPINVDAEVVTRRKPNKYGHTVKFIDAVPPLRAGTSGTSGQPAADSGKDTGRWTNDPKYKHSYRAKVADHGFFKNADVGSMTGKWAAHRLEKGFQKLLAPNSDFKRTGASRFATDPKQRYTGPDSGQKMNLGSEYEDAPKNVSAGRSKYKTK